MAAVEVPYQNVVERVTSLPLVSSTYGMVFSLYCNTKDSHPYIKSVCEAAEQGVKTITSVALISAMPIISKLELQIAIANDLACKGLDKIEKTLPILHQPSDQIVANAKDVVTGAKDVVSVRVTGAKDTVSDTLSCVVDRTRGVMQDGVEMTRAVVSGSVYTVLESRVARLVSSGVDTALGTSESLVDQYLPLTEDELELEAETVKGFDQKEPSYYVRLGSLSTKLRKRTYAKALAKVQDAKQRSQESISQLNHTVDLVEYARKNINGANQRVYDKLSSLMEGKSSGPVQEENGHKAEVIESYTLALARSLTEQLQTTCLVLVSGLKGLPNHVRQEALSLSRLAAQVYTSFSKATDFGDLPDSVLASTKSKLGQMKDSMDSVMDYLVNNTPLNWLVGPFYPRLPPPGQAPVSSATSTPPKTSSTRPLSSSPATTSSTCHLSPPHQKAPMEVEMESIDSNKQ